MIAFAVSIEGVEQAQWVLAVERDELLTADAEGKLVWYPLEKCRLVRAHPPDAPTPVLIVQPVPGNDIVQLPSRGDQRRFDREAREPA